MVGSIDCIRIRKIIFCTMLILFWSASITSVRAAAPINTSKQNDEASIIPQPNDLREPLSEQEREWLALNNGQIRIGITVIPPQVLYVDKEYKGLSIDYIHLLEHKIGCSFKLIPYNTWNDVIQAAKMRQIDVIFAAQQTPERLGYLSFTEPYIELPNMILVRNDRKGGEDLKNMNGWRVAISEGSAVQEYLNKKFPDLNLSPVSDELSGLIKVSMGELDAMVVEISRASYYLEKAKILNLRVSGNSGLVYKLRFAVRNDWPILCRILDKGLVSATDEEKLDINKRWVLIYTKSLFTNRTLWVSFSIALTVITLFIAVVVIWNRTLNRTVKERTLQLHQELSEHKQTEEALKGKTKFLDKIIEASALSMWISDEKGTAIRTNPACLKFFGATEEEVVGKYNLFKDAVIEKKGFMPIIKDIFENGKPASFVIDYDFGAVEHVDVRNATHKIIQTVLTPVLDNNKKVSNVIVQAIDLTEIKNSEEEKIRVNKLLSEHEKLSLVGQVAGKMAHDFNNILGIIMGNTELALIDCPDDQTKKKLDLIYNQTIRGKNLTKNLVAFAKDQEPKQEFFSIHEKMDLVLNLLKKDLDGINVIRQYSHGIPELLADSGMIEHAIVNLVQNSIHAVSLVERPQIIIRIYYREDFIFFEIEDNGCGIPSEFLGEIYEPSFTLKGSRDKTGMYKPGIKGTGYGMSNVKRYIEQHKGGISIHSELKKGTNVIIKLPVIKKELTDDEIKNIKKEKIYFERYILLVEDEQAISDIQYRILTHAPYNHKVDVADTGQMAIDLLERNRYDLICLDYVLPGNFNGMDVYHRIREINNTVPVLFISGNIEFLESIKDLKQRDPYIDHLSKPCKNIDYVSCINKLFGIVTFCDKQLPIDHLTVNDAN